MTSRKSNHKEIIRKQNILLYAKKQLKKEFIGIDKIIDEIIDSLSSWFLFPYFQNRPTIINLWGLTGVGKTALVRRLAELINFENRFYSFNVARTNISRYLENIYEYDNGFPIILSLDEFQYAHTVDEKGNDNTYSDVIWDLLDSGIYYDNDIPHEVDKLNDLIIDLKYYEEIGVKVSKGRVVVKLDQFEGYFQENDLQFFIDDKKFKYRPKPKVVYFVDKDEYKSIYKLSKGLHKFITPNEVRNKLLEKNERETIDFLSEIAEHAGKPKKIDCSRSLIFVIGNLDEAYTMSRDFNTDIHADEFHERSLKITVPDIKNALKYRFRSEHIARLGNNHIIYPAINSASFRKFIEKELFSISDKFKKQFNIQIRYDHSVHELLYNESVYPTQGMRPVLSSIHRLIDPLISKIAEKVTLNTADIDSVMISFKETTFRLNYSNLNKTVFTDKSSSKITLETIRECKKDDKQAIVAVHESGHALCSVFLMNTIPELINSSSTDTNTGGLTHIKYQWEYISRKEIINRLAVYLGGFVAEEMIFGKEHVTIGSESDIVKATEFISGMLKSSGMGNALVNYVKFGYNGDLVAKDTKHRINDEIHDYMKKARDLAENTLRNQRILLLKMADFLSDHRKLEKYQISGFCKKYGEDFSSQNMITDGKELYYRKQLKKYANEHIPQNTDILKDSYDIVLNKEK